MASDKEAKAAVIEQIIEKHGETYIHKGILQSRFEEVFGALSTENDDLDRLVRGLRRQLDEALARKRDVLVILGTFNWLQENIFNEDIFRDAVRDVFGQDMAVYRGLLTRLEALFSSKQLKDGRLIPWEERRRTPGKFPGVEEEKDVFWCAECQLGFRDEEDLHRHIKSKCKYTGEEAFYKKREAEETARARERALYCEICEYRAKNAGGMASHKRSKKHQENARLLGLEMAPAKKTYKRRKAGKGKKK